MAIWKQCLWSGLVLGLLACGEPAEDRFETVTKLKILAVRAESPDLYPGQSTRVEVLMAAPQDISVTTFLQPFAADLVQDFGQGDADLQGGGLAFQVTGSTYPCYPLPMELTRCLPFDLTRTGVEKPGIASFEYRAPAMPGSFFVAVGAQEGRLDLSPDLDLAEEARRALKAVKTIRVLPEGEALNRNPEVWAAEVTHRWRVENAESLRIEQEPLPLAGLTMDTGEMVRVRLQFDDEDADRVSATWWISEGSIRGFGRTDMDYVAPARAGLVTVIGLLLDRQGGNTWWIQDLAVQPEALAPDIGGDHTMLVRSAGRMFWLGFEQAATAATVADVLSGGEPAIVEGDLVAHPSSRLGWNLGGPVLVESPELVTGSTITATDIREVSAAGRRVYMRIDEIIDSRL